MRTMGNEATDPNYSLATIGSGIAGGAAGGVIIWIYEALVWVGIQHLMPLAGIPRNATGLVFGKAFQSALGWKAYVLGTAIHFGFAIAWGMAFAACWPWFRARGWSAVVLGIVFAPLLWVVMHVAIALAGHEHPDYLDPVIIASGIASHLFYAVPMALMISRMLRETNYSRRNP